MKLSLFIFMALLSTFAQAKDCTSQITKYIVELGNKQDMEFEVNTYYSMKVLTADEVRIYYPELAQYIGNSNYAIYNVPVWIETTEEDSFGVVVNKNTCAVIE